MNNQIVPSAKPWVRSDNGLIVGVCQGIGEKFGIDPWIVRAVLLIAMLAFGTGFLAYIILALTLPRESEAYLPPEKKVLGVCLQLSRRTGIDIGLLRALTVFSAFASLGITLLAYFIIYFVNENSNGNVIV